MQFATIDVDHTQVTVVDGPNLEAVQIVMGLDKVDHGVVAPGIGIVVDEFGLYTPTDKQSYFAIFGRLYAGNAVLYGFNRQGESVDLLTLPPVLFMPSAAAVERNIELGIVHRPQITVNGVVTWQWPDPEH
jgi:hypothetical protein